MELNELALVVMVLLAVALLALMVYGLQPLLVAWAKACPHPPSCPTPVSILLHCKLTFALAVVRRIRGQPAVAAAPSPAAAADVRSEVAHDDVEAQNPSYSKGRGSSARHANRSTAFIYRKRPKVSPHLPRSPGVIWTACVFEGRPTVVTLGSDDPLADFDSWKYRQCHVGAPMRFPDSSSSSTSTSSSVQWPPSAWSPSTAPSSEEALVEVRPSEEYAAEEGDAEDGAGSAAGAAAAAGAATASGAGPGDPRCIPSDALLRDVWGALSLRPPPTPCASRSAPAILDSHRPRPQSAPALSTDPDRPTTARDG